MEHLAGKILTTKKFSLSSEPFHSPTSILFYRWKKPKPRDLILTTHTTFYIPHTDITFCKEWDLNQRCSAEPALTALPVSALKHVMDTRGIL